MGTSEAVIMTGRCCAVCTEKLCWLCLRFSLDVSQDQGSNCLCILRTYQEQNRAVSEGSQFNTIQNNWLLVSFLQKTERFISLTQKLSVSLG